MRETPIEEINTFLKSAESILDKDILDQESIQSLNKEADRLIEKIGESRSYFKRLL